ncbi:HlyD family efflux transporter periplasmic adaptor subunit [Pseudenhygromyxa sp. WMMC2535]|uniref:HlyD family secretion protein n=1 Tax=Pseudenhygromyxa sp. WMMC2535 TaxID=2712867 RepID=UPI0015576419|nr:HlyD family efflux transporter periplasmic adaptor subunit [Pseudenhygromyxa sp. WMMC2535]NVB38063.1 HlyD family efflux transporter periplasmic adaptor subunit [Pseudenhygromyxa sp. WMMC2535]
MSSLDNLHTSALHRARPSMLESRTPRAARVLARLIGAASLLLIMAMFAPWQQSLPGTGRVIAYAPLERQQAIEAPIEGRIVRWHVQEGSRVRAGTPIAEISDNDPDILDRIERQRRAAQMAKSAAQGSVDVAEARITALELAGDAKRSSAGLRVDMSRDRLRAAERAVDAAEAAERAARLNLDRRRALYEEGLSSKRDLELAEMEFETKHAGLDRAEANLEASKREVEALGADRSFAGADASASVESAKSSLRKAESELAKAESELQKVEVRLARQRRMTIVAPRDGTVLQQIVKQDGQMVKAGDPVASFVPDMSSSAVELWVQGRDGPLVTSGRKVRLQFQGWPAVQFVGWPSAAVGTFGGEVVFVDATADASGRFRVVVRPDPNDEPWPESRWLRQGVRVNGWVLLDQVSLGFELWRQFNGFPPVVDPGGEPVSAGKVGK